MKKTTTTKKSNAATKKSVAKTQSATQPATKSTQDSQTKQKTMRKAFACVLKNPTLITPLLAQLITFVLLAALFFAAALLSVFLIYKELTPEIFNQLGPILIGLVGLFSFILVAFLLNAYFQATTWHMAKNASMQNAKASLSSFREAKTYFTKFLSLSVFKSLFYFAAAVLSLPFIILNVFIGIVVLIACVVFIELATLFTQPLIIEKNLSGLESCKASFDMLKRRLSFVVKTGLVCLLVCLAIIVPFEVLSFFTQNTQALNIFVEFLSVAANIFLSVYLTVFLTQKLQEKA